MDLGARERRIDSLGDYIRDWLECGEDGGLGELKQQEGEKRRVITILG